MAFDISITPPTIPEVLKGKEFQSLISITISNALLKEGKRLQGRMKKVSPRGGTGELRNSWQVSSVQRRGDTIFILVSSSAIQALVVEEGTTRKNPFPPEPRTALKRWVRRKLKTKIGRETDRAAFFVAKKISEGSLKPRRIFSKEFNKFEPKSIVRIGKAIKLLAKRISKG